MKVAYEIPAKCESVAEKMSCTVDKDVVGNSKCLAVPNKTSKQVTLYKKLCTSHKNYVKALDKLSGSMKWYKNIFCYLCLHPDEVDLHKQIPCRNKPGKFSPLAVDFMPSFSLTLDHKGEMMKGGLEGILLEEGRTGDGKGQTVDGMTLFFPILSLVY